MNTWCHSISVTFKFWCWVPRESVLRGSSAHKATRTAQNLKVTLIEWLLKLTLLEWHQVFRPIFIILLCISWFSRVVSNHPNCHHHILHAKLRVGMVPKSLFATKMLQLCFHCLIYMYIWLCRVQGLTYDRCIQVLHLVHTKQIFDHIPKNCFVQYANT